MLDHVERQKESLQCEQERWAEWHAIQEEALMEQIRHVESQEDDLVRREMILADAFRSLERDAIELDQRQRLIEKERKALQTEKREFQHLWARSRQPQSTSDYDSDASETRRVPVVTLHSNLDQEWYIGDPEGGADDDSLHWDSQALSRHQDRTSALGDRDRDRDRDRELERSRRNAWGGFLRRP